MRVEQLQIQAHAVGQRGRAAADDHRIEEQLALVDEPGGQRLRRQVRPADRQVGRSGALEGADPVGVEAALEAGVGRGHRLQRGRVHDLVGRAPDLRVIAGDSDSSGEVGESAQYSSPRTCAARRGTCRSAARGR